MVIPAWGGNSPDSLSSPGSRGMAQRALPYAEKHDIKLAPEIDATMMSNPRETDAYLDLINRTRTRHLGITLDAGMFQRHPTRLISEAGAEVSQTIQPLLTYLFHLRCRYRGPYLFRPNADF